jgi:6-phosphogluconolactonase
MLRIEVRSDPEAVAIRAAELVAEAVRAATEARGRFAWAISGGATPFATFRRLAELDLPWDEMDTWQVDERIAPLGDHERNRTAQSETLPEGLLDRIRWMPVDDPDPEEAARRYAATLPERFDLVQLGLGADGHTASLLPGDPVLEVRQRDVAITLPYRGSRRMTLTYPGLARGRGALWIVTGDEKREALAMLVAGDPSIPAARVSVADQTLVTDRDPGSGARGPRLDPLTTSSAQA